MSGAAPQGAVVASRGAQRGVSLIYSLLALVALSMAAVALVRSVDGGSLVMGNLGFKQDATLTADQAAEQAIAWLAANAGATLHADVPASGYYASSLDALDPTGEGSISATRAVVDWAGDNCATYAAGSFATCRRASAEIALNAGNRARYVITRLCSVEGNPSSTAVDCASPLQTAASISPNRGEVNYGTGRLSATISAQYYRVIVRAQGPRSTVSFTETILHF